MENIKITYKGIEHEYPKGITLLEVSKDFALDFKYDIIYSKVDEKYQELSYSLKRDCTVEFYDYTSVTGSRVYENGLLFLLVVATHKVLNREIIVKHSLDKGIYCEVMIKRLLTQDDIDAIKEEMLRMVKEKLPFKPTYVNRLETMKMYEKKGMTDKAQMLRYISNSYIKLYFLSGECDYFYSDMPIDTSYLKKFELSLVGKRGLIVIPPNIYKNNVMAPYIHRDKIYEGFENYESWSIRRYGIKHVSDLNTYVSNNKINEVIRASEAYYGEQLSTVSTKIANDSNIKFVLIAGPSSSGKTTSSLRLSELLAVKGLTPMVISTDDYFIPLDKRPLDENGKPEMEAITAVDTALFNKHMKELLEGKTVEKPVYNFVTGDREYNGDYLKLDGSSVLIIEGIHALNEKLTKLIDDKYKYRIYLFPMTAINIDNHNRIRSTDNRLLRRIVRDNSNRGYDVAKTLNSWPTIRSGEEKNVFPFQGEADFVINTSLLYEFGVLKTYVEPLLFSVKESDSCYSEALRLINLFRCVLPIPSEKVPENSILREFIGGSCYK